MIKGIVLLSFRDIYLSIYPTSTYKVAFSLFFGFKSLFFGQTENFSHFSDFKAGQDCNGRIYILKIFYAYSIIPTVWKKADDIIYKEKNITQTDIWERIL